MRRERCDDDARGEGKRNCIPPRMDVSQDQMIPGTDVFPEMPVVKTHGHPSQRKQVNQQRRGEALPRRRIQRPQEKRSRGADESRHHR